MIARLINRVAQGLGYCLVEMSYPRDMEAEFIGLYERCADHTLLSIERMYALHKATQYIIRNDIVGDIVECGVWQGGSAMLTALTMMQMGQTARQIYLYDTYAGMSEPAHIDVSFEGEDARKHWERNRRGATNKWCYAPLHQVRANLGQTGYPPANLIFVEGRVENTLPARLPSPIALLHLDTDWYESTYHELVHLYPTLSPKGVLILDDYGHWQGARRAVEQYFDEQGICPLLSRTDYTGRVLLKT